MKKFTVIFFLSFIFLIPIIGFIIEDKLISEVENKILTQFKSPTINTILNKTFMTNFDSYVSDQFPFRDKFIELKNKYTILTGQNEIRNIYITDNRLLEKFEVNDDILNSNLYGILKINNLLKDYNISSKVIIVPTSIAFYEEKLKEFNITDNQLENINYIESYLKDYNIDFYTPYNILNKYKDKYIYFKTDHHWTQLGAYITYMDLYYNNVNETLLNKNYEKVSDNFLGTYYSKVLYDKIKSDEIYSYKDFNNFNIEIDFQKKYKTLYDIDKLKTKNKYQYFLHGDPAYAIIDCNNNLQKEVLIFKDSYAHNFIPFLTNNYSKIHIVDIRYYNIDLVDYLTKNTNIKECLFLHNIKTFNDTKIYK